MVSESYIAMVKIHHTKRIVIALRCFSTWFRSNGLTDKAYDSKPDVAPAHEHLSMPISLLGKGKRKMPSAENPRPINSSTTANAPIDAPSSVLPPQIAPTDNEPFELTSALSSLTLTPTASEIAIAATQRAGAAIETARTTPEAEIAAATTAGTANQMKWATPSESSALMNVMKKILEGDIPAQSENQTAESRKVQLMNRIAQWKLKLASVNAELQRNAKEKALEQTKKHRKRGKKNRRRQHAQMQRRRKMPKRTHWSKRRRGDRINKSTRRRRQRRT